MIYPTLFFKHLKVRRAIRDYPLYDVPNKQEERTLDEASVQANFAYFMRVRLDRLAFFQNWLRDWFGVRAALNGDGLLALNGWINRYGGGLIDDATNIQTIFETYQPAWRGKYAGYNVMVDIGIFIGEYLITKRPQLRWEIYRGHLNDDSELTGPNLKRPNLAGFPRQWTEDALGLGYGVIAGSRKRAHIAGRPHLGDRNAMINHCKQSLQLANAPDNGTPYIFGDYSNEPI
ncbi:hypothetical protein [Bradyrhizobium sp. BR13661]|jgi:hypothetical protein|uniref:hypothetical protein n=1 Tax=Bradyrhizobium sp. BR13661 TaxID=2940622 RepID=UPI0024752E0B|nr:hypothetical protein [Bradyrhizobium sp. BR13661]MDH6259750.1 hypothetical protein [Bradyrhizobium sp. BR13661]